MRLDLNNLSLENLKKLDLLSLKIQSDFNNLSKGILNNLNENLACKISNVVSRNNYQSDLFINCLHLTFISEELRSNKEIKEVFLNNSSLNKILKSNFNGVKFTYRNSFSKYLKKTLLRPIVDIFNNLIISYYSLVSKETARVFKLKKNKKIILIDTFILENSLNKSEFIDRYYNNILNYTESRINDEILFVPSIYGKYNSRILNDINEKSNYNFLYKCDFLSTYDFCKVFYLMFSQKFNNNKIFFNEFDLTDLIRSEFHKNKFNTSSFEGLLNYFFIKKLKKNNFKISLFINWFENQPIDKGLIKGMKDYFPRIKTKGYQGFVAAYNYSFHLIPTDYENDLGLIPDEIIVTGDGLIPIVKKFDKNLVVKTGPALRYYSYENLPFKMNSINNTILIILPIGMSNAVLLIKKIIRVFDLMDKIDYKIFIKPHPIDEKNIRKIIFHFNKYNFEIVTSKFEKIIHKVNLCIGNSSSALIESLLHSVPVIVISDEKNIIQNPIPETVDKLYWNLCYSNNEILNAIEQLLNLSKKDLLDMKEEIEKKYFIKPTLKNVLKLLKN